MKRVFLSLLFVAGLLSAAAQKDLPQLPEFSTCGYASSEQPIPAAAVVMVVETPQGDATQAIQAALKKVASMPVGSDGLRGAVVLGEGKFHVSGNLVINASGVVLRGSGMGKTILEASNEKGTSLLKLSGKGRKTIDHAGVENMSIIGAENAVCLDGVSDSWVRRMVFENCSGTAVMVTQASSHITVEDCLSKSPALDVALEECHTGLVKPVETDAYHCTFYVKGTQCLFQRIQAHGGYHDFAVGASQGPNSFVQCWSVRPYSYSGTVEALSTEVLFDLCAVDDNALRFGNPDPANAVDGATTMNSVMWNSQASLVSCDKPLQGENWSFGAWGQFNGKGTWSNCNNHQSPWSLFYTQWAKRMGHENSEEAKLIHLHGGGTSTIEDARFQSQYAREGVELLSDRIAKICAENPLPIK